MKIKDFKLECYFGLYEFTAPYLLTQSDCESMRTEELLAMEPGAQEGYLKQWLGYTETWGDPDLRRAIAGLYQSMSAENVLVFHGAQEAIFGYMNVMLDPGDHMIAMYPNYQSAYEVANSVPGCELSKWYVRDDGEKWVVDFDELESVEPIRFRHGVGMIGKQFIRRGRAGMQRVESCRLRQPGVGRFFRIVRIYRRICSDRRGAP